MSGAAPVRPRAEAGHASADPAADAASADAVRRAARRRALWLKRVHSWHWISSAVCLVAMLVFALTGITLNHAEDIAVAPQVRRQVTQLPPALLREVQARAPAAIAATADGVAEGPAVALPEAARVWLARQLDEPWIDVSAEWTPQAVHLDLRRPGGESRLQLVLGSGVVEHERTDRGLIALLNDLHKGRHAGPLWRWALDLLAVACLVFTLTGLWLLKLHAGHRRLTWPLVAAGLVVPAGFVALWLH